MRKPTTRLWVLLSILMALLIAYGGKRAHSVYTRTAVASPVLEVSKELTEHWVIEGIATSTAYDMNGTRFGPKVMKEGVEQLLSYRSVFYNHNHSTPIGRVVDASLGDGGIWVTVEISKSQPWIWRMIREGNICSFSISAVVLEETPDWNYLWDCEVTVIDRAYIIEVSVVNVPANPEARIVLWYVDWR